VSHVPLEKFGDAFALWATYGKLANLVAEIGDVDKFAEERLKAFTSGDPMQFERKYRDSVSAIPTAKLIFATNVLPTIRDKSDGLWRRMRLLQFHVTIPDEQINPHLIDDLRVELSGIFLWAVTGAVALRNSRRFIEPAASAEAKDSYRLASNPVAQFLDEHCLPSAGGMLSTKDLYAIYRDWANDNGFCHANRPNFSREVQRKFSHVTIKREYGVNGSRRYYFQGLAYQGQAIVETIPSR